LDDPATLSKPNRGAGIRRAAHPAIYIKKL
jgi:hypothetical protein